MADVVTQASLIELKGSRVKRLDNVFIRPTPETKKLGGVLQIHENGLRYQSSFKQDQRVDVLFSNIKHLFFQPSKDELIVLIHCHLKNPLMIGKRKTYDVQFYREASDMAFDETGGRKENTGMVMMMNYNKNKKKEEEKHFWIKNSKHLLN